VECYVDVSRDVRLWVEQSGRREGSPLLLVMGANSSGVAWPDELVARLGEHHRVVRYDHRDTGRSTWAFDQQPYAVADLARDAVAVLDGLGIDRAHVVGMSMGGTLAQLLLLDHPDRLLSATILATAVLEGAGPDGAPAPFGDIDPRLLALWDRLADPRGREEEIAFRVEHWRLLNGDEVPFDADEFHRLEEHVVDHTGRHDNPAAHARADQSGLDRGAELASVAVPTLVVEAPADPINPPPSAARIADAIPGADLVTIPGMGHALGSPVVVPLAEAILVHTRRVDVTDGSADATGR
jgi:pimeloyl-ACP methyl ester carboxylesterase